MATQQQQSTALVQSVNTLKTLVNDEKFRAAIADVLPKHITPEQMAKFALIAANKNALILKCTRESVAQCIMDAATLGLDLSGLGGRGYIVPYYNNKKGAYEAVFIAGYRGLMDVVRRSAMVSSIWAEVVYEGDEFHVEYGTNHSLRHTPNFTADRSDDKIIGAYACAKIKGTGDTEFRFLPRTELDAIKNKALSKIKNKSSSPYETDTAAMFRKAPIRRLCSDLPMSAEILTLLDREAKYEDAIDMEPVSVRVSDPSTSIVERLTTGNANEDNPFDESFDPSAPPEAEPEPDQPADDSAAPMCSVCKKRPGDPAKSTETGDAICAECARDAIMARPINTRKAE